MNKNVILLKLPYFGQRVAINHNIITQVNNILWYDHHVKSFILVTYSRLRNNLGKKVGKIIMLEVYPSLHDKPAHLKYDLCKTQLITTYHIYYSYLGCLQLININIPTYIYIYIQGDSATVLLRFHHTNIQNRVKYTSWKFLYLN